MLIAGGHGRRTAPVALAGAGRSGAEARGTQENQEKKVGRTEDELKGVRASTLKRLLRSPFSGTPGLERAGNAVAEVTGLAVNVSATAESLVTPIVLAPDGSGVR